MLLVSIKSKFVKNFSLPIIDTVIANPSTPMTLKGAWVAFKIAYCLFDDLYPTESQEFLKQVRGNIIDIGVELYNSKEFQQSLLITFETLLRTRDEKKRHLIKSIFLNQYMQSNNRNKVSLERLYRVIDEISIEALEHLKFIDEQILPMKLETAKKKLEEMNKENREHGDNWWLNRFLEDEHESKHIQNWLYMEFNPNSPKLKAKDPTLGSDKLVNSKWFAKEKAWSKSFHELSSELINLGIFRQVSAYDGLEYGFTEFGRQFLIYIKNI